MKIIKRGFFTRIGAPGVSLLALTVGLVLTGSQAAWAKSHADPTNITACGTYNSNGTIYLLTQNITTTSTGNCIVLGGHDNTLNLQGYNITYTGTAGTSNGAGLFIECSAYEDVIEGYDSTISGFAEGVLDKGTNTAGDNIIVLYNGIGLEMAGGNNATEIWINFGADDNTAQGVYLKSCGNECTISDFGVVDNGADGVLVTGSQGPRISNFVSTGNGGDGVHVGCTSGCGNNSKVKVGDAPQGYAGWGTPAISGNAGDGVFLDKSESTAQDRIFLIYSSSNAGIDLHDYSSGCGANQWVANDYVTANANGVSYPACIPLTSF